MREITGRELEVMIRIGKSGLTEGMVNEIILQLKKKRIIKIKILKAAFHEIGKDKIIQDLLNKTSSNLVSKIGNTIVVRKGKI